MSTRDRLLGLFTGVIKSVPDAALDDLKQVADQYDAGGRDKVPSAEELGLGSKAIAMRSATAVPLTQSNEKPEPQEGVTQMYADFASRMGTLEKSVGIIATTVGSLVDGVKKATAEPEAPVVTEKAFTASLAALKLSLRKAKFAVAKAEDEKDDDEDKEEAMDKAEKALDAVRTNLAKAEDDAEDDKDEDEVEKANTSFKTHRDALKAVKTKKAAKAVAAPAAAPVPATVEDVKKAIDPILQGLGINTTTIEQMMAAVATKDPSATAVVKPPVFSKAAPADFADVIQTRIAEAEDAGKSTHVIMKAGSLLTRYRGVAEGKVDSAAFESELSKADVAVQDFFALPVAAAA